MSHHGDRNYGAPKKLLGVSSEIFLICHWAFCAIISSSFQMIMDLLSRHLAGVVGHEGI
jgi:hypothetical protein